MTRNFQKQKIQKSRSLAFSPTPHIDSRIISFQASVLLPVGIVPLGEAAVDAVVDGGAVVLDGEPGAMYDLGMRVNQSSVLEFRLVFLGLKSSVRHTMSQSLVDQFVRNLLHF